MVQEIPTVKQMMKINKAYLKDALAEITNEYNSHSDYLKKSLVTSKAKFSKLSERVKVAEKKHQELVNKLEAKPTKALKERLKKSAVKLKAETAMLRTEEKNLTLLKNEQQALTATKKMQKALNASVQQFYKTYAAEQAESQRKMSEDKASAKAEETKLESTVEPVVEQISVISTDAVSPVLAVSDAAPEFSLMNDQGELVSLEQFKGQQVVLYFYPKDDTPGCTQESKDFSALQEQFSAANTIILGLSRDSVSSHAKFKEKYGFNFPLLSDADEVVCNGYGVIKEKNRYGKMVKGIERSTFLIDTNGDIKNIWRNVRVAGHAEAVLEAATSACMVPA